KAPRSPGADRRDTCVRPARGRISPIAPAEPVDRWAGPRVLYEPDPSESKQSRFGQQGPVLASICPCQASRRPAPGRVAVAVPPLPPALKANGDAPAGASPIFCLHVSLLQRKAVLPPPPARLPGRRYKVAARLGPLHRRWPASTPLRMPPPGRRVRGRE